MNKLTENLAAKITAIVLSFIAFAVLISSLCGIFIMLESDGYSESNAEIKSDVLKYRIGNKHIYNILDLYSSGQSTTIYSEDQNIYYLIEDAETGGVIDGNYNGEAFLVKQQSERLTAYEERVQTDQYGNETIEEIEKGDLLVIHDTGAHGFAMGYNYNGRLRSAEVLLKEDGSTQLIRRAETPDDYFATFDCFDILKNMKHPEKR